MAFNKIMPEFVADTEPLETFARNIGCIEDAERVAVSQQHPRYTVRRIRLGLHDDVPAAGEREWIDRQAGDPLLLQQRLGGLLGHLRRKTWLMAYPFFL